MSEQLDQMYSSLDEQMKKGIAHLDSELLKIRAGKASPQMLDGIMVEYYGAPTPLSQVANVSTPDARTINIQPWEKSLIGPIEKGILMANIGLTPQNDGILIKLYLPPLTEERRKEMVKRVNNEGEAAKIVVRNARRDAIENVKKQQKDGLSEDIAKGAETDIQNTTDKYIAIVDSRCKDKEKEIMTI